MKRETGRHSYIRLLRSRADAIDELPSDRRDHILWADLIAAGYLNGVTRTDENGIPNGNVITGATVKGRLFLQELESLEDAQTWKGRAIRYSIPVAMFFAGIVSSVLIDWLKKVLGL